MSDPSAQAEAVVSEYVRCEEVRSRADAEYKAARKSLLDLFPKEAGEHELIAGPWRAEVNYPGTMKWDSDELAAYYGTDIPLHVKRSLSIDVRDYNRLPGEEKQMLAKCFVPALGSPKISVEVK
jgi:hypothetical protein